MSTNREIPAVEAVKDDRARFALSAIKEQLETITGRRGTALDRGLTVRDLTQAGLIECDQRGNVVKKEEDDQVAFKDQSLKTLETIITAIATADVGAAGAYSIPYQNLQTDLLNECKAKLNELIAAIRNGKFQ